MIDLHLHSTASDGTDSPAQIVAMAAALGLRAIALTDHDTADGLAEALAAGKQHDLPVIPGIEFTSSFDGTEVHLLGYGFDPASPALTDALAFSVQFRARRNRQVVQMLQNAGFAITLEALEAKNPGAIIGRPHIANVLVELGAAESVKDAFDRYLGEGKPFWLPREYIPMEQAACSVADAGGVAVLAHPLQYEFSPEKLRQLVEYARSVGVRGMEVYYTGYTTAQREALMALADEYHLFPTGGSDYHGRNKPDISMGTGRGELLVPDSLLDELLASIQ